MVRPFWVCIGTRLDNAMESIRNTMQMHEDIFKQQVRELHRLYSVQKILMDELKNEIKTNRFWTSSMKNNSTSSDIMNQSQSIHQHQLTTQNTSGFNLLVEEDQAGPSSTTKQMMNNEGFDEDSEAELSLSIGIGGSSSSKKLLKDSTSSQSVHKEITRELDSSASWSGPNTPMSSSSATLGQESKLPHWIFQGFSLNMT